VKYNRIALVSLAAFVALACHSDRITQGTPPVPVLLKDVVIENLPSPYYHFDYDSTGRVRAMSFASQLTNDDVVYDGEHIAELHNSGPGLGQRLVYVYDDSGRVSLVKYFDAAPSVYELVSLTYKGKQLVGLERDRRVTGGFVIDKTMTFTYYADGNLKDIVDHRAAVEGLQPEGTTTDHFEDYDDNVNVDSFGLLHNDFFDHFVLIPGVKLQKGNPHKETFTGGSDDYVVTFTYTYDELGRPTAKVGDLTLLNGPNAGAKFPTLTTFTYY